LAAHVPPYELIPENHNPYSIDGVPKVLDLEGKPLYVAIAIHEENYTPGFVKFVIDDEGNSTPHCWYSCGGRQLKAKHWFFVKGELYEKGQKPSNTDVPGFQSWHGEMLCGIAYTEGNGPIPGKCDWFHSCFYGHGGREQRSDDMTYVKIKNGV